MKVVGIGTELSVGKVVDITNSAVIIEKNGKRVELTREEVENILKGK